MGPGPASERAPFSRGSSQPRDRTEVSRTAGRRFLSEPPRSPACGQALYRLSHQGSLILAMNYLLSEPPRSPACGQALYRLSHQGSLILAMNYLLISEGSLPHFLCVLVLSLFFPLPLSFFFFVLCSALSHHF